VSKAGAEGASGGQLYIDFYTDDRMLELSKKVSVMLAPHVASGTDTKKLRDLADRVAVLAESVFRDFKEPKEPMRCHSCDELTLVGNRVRVPVCNRCAHAGRSPGCGY
jgi:hypothetical protein